MDEWLRELIKAINQVFPPGTMLHYPWMVKGFLSVTLVGVICGGVGSLVVGNRMAFFSDALSHTAYAGVVLALLMCLYLDVDKGTVFFEWSVPGTMVVFGIITGIGIAYVREKTGLASDTVIGVFFALAIGFGALLFGALSHRGYFNIEQFLFGSPLFLSESALIMLVLLCLVTIGFLMFMYNRLLFTSFNPSLAKSRNISERVCNYVFIILLAMIVNLCLIPVGAMLINTLLIVPAATAGNLCRNMRQMFWTSIALGVGVGILGVWFSWSVQIPIGGRLLYLGTSGVIVVFSVLLFFASMAVGPWLKRQAHSSLSSAQEAK
jgi:zinc transport system permease protein